MKKGMQYVKKANRGEFYLRLSPVRAGFEPIASHAHYVDFITHSDGGATINAFCIGAGCPACAEAAKESKNVDFRISRKRKSAVLFTVFELEAVEGQLSWCGDQPKIMSLNINRDGACYDYEKMVYLAEKIAAKHLKKTGIATFAAGEGAGYLWKVTPIVKESAAGMQYTIYDVEIVLNADGSPMMLGLPVANIDACYEQYRSLHDTAFRMTAADMSRFLVSPHAVQVGDAGFECKELNEFVCCLKPATGRGVAPKQAPQATIMSTPPSFRAA